MFFPFAVIFRIYNAASMADLHVTAISGVSAGKTESMEDDLMKRMSLSRTREAPRPV
jgi:hypothetical protein